MTRARLAAVAAALLRRRTAAIAASALGVVLVVAGLGLAYPPAGVVAAGVALLALTTFDPDAAGRLSWPR